MFDPGQVCRWIKGQKKLSPQISSFYLKPANQKKLHKTIERDILPMMTDSAMALQELYDLLQQDQDISDRMREQLSQPEEADFLTEILLFAMKRNFVKRDAKALPPPTGLSPVIQDLVYDAGSPGLAGGSAVGNGSWKPCTSCFSSTTRYFCTESPASARASWRRRMPADTQRNIPTSSLFPAGAACCRLWQVWILLMIARRMRKNSYSSGTIGSCVP